MKRWLLFSTLALLLLGCRRGMYNQPRMKPLRASEVFPDKTSARHIPAHAVPYRAQNPADVWSSGIEADGTLARSAPVPIDMALLERGRERFDIYCMVCHGATGKANGMIVQRGFPAPPSFHGKRLREAPIGHFVNVIGNGFGVMYGYGDRVDARDRWAIAAYLRVLQLSQNAPAELLTSDERQRLEGQP